MKTLSKLLLLFALITSSTFLFANTISVENAYVREVPPGVPTSALFLTLKNTSNTDIALIKVNGDIAKNIELHEHVHKDGMMEMRQVDKINVVAKGTTELKPGGFHIMLIGLTKRIKAGDQVKLTLKFDNGSKLTIKPTVKKVMQGMMKQDMKMPKNHKMDSMK